MSKRLIEFFFLISFIFSLCGQDLDFNRRHKPGTIFNAKIAAVFTVNCELRKQIGQRREIRKERSFDFEGIIEIVECNENSVPTILRLKSERIVGHSEGHGEALFKEGYDEFTIKWNGDKMELDLSGGKEASSSEAEILRIAFRPPGSQCKLDELLGEKEPFEIGRSWELPKNYLKKIFAQRGLALKDEDIKAIGIFKERQSSDGLDCALINVEIKIWGVENFDFEYKAEILLPFENGMLPLKTKTASLEKIKIANTKRTENAGIADFDEMLLHISYTMDVELREKN